MPWYDLPLDQLREYRTSTVEPAGLDDWWRGKVQQARDVAQAPRPVRYREDLYQSIEVHDTQFSGAGGDLIRAWYLRPANATGRTPHLVKFIGYGGGRSLPNDHLMLPALGYGLLVMDTRGQGGRWSPGATGDSPAGGGVAGPENSTVMTRGIASPETYYYTRLFTDAVLAVDAVRALAGPDAPLGVTGVSQGGGLAIATAALHGDAIRVCHADVPFLCDFQRAITLAPKPPYTEIPEFLDRNVDLIDAALDTLRYVDCALLARRVTASTLVSVGLMDITCPPSTVFAAYNEIPATDKEIAVFPYSGHDSYPSHVERQLAHLREHLPAAG
ncbi:MAG TPA: acetylxylan esterase [Trebonia sp.]|jgi:cephalosporin-C deacetylase|nr:acetylxylan esterase [Trebonia sp.]